MVGLRRRQVYMLKVFLELRVDPVPGWPAPLSGYRLRRIICIFSAKIDRISITHRDTGLKQKHFFAATRHKINRLGRFSEMIKQTIAVHDIKTIIEIGVGIVAIQMPHFDIWISGTEYVEITFACVCTDNLTAPVYKKARMIPNSGPDLQYRGAVQIQSQTGKMLKPSLVVALVMVRKKRVLRR